MTGPTEIQVDVGGSLVFDPPQMGRPSSATCTLYKPDGTSIASPVVTIDSVSTTLSASAAAKATTLTLTSVTGVTVGRRYIVTGSDGQSEWVRVKSVDSGTKVATLFEATSYAYDSADTFVGNRLTIPVSAGNAATLDEGYEARLTYTISGTSYMTTVWYDVVRSVWSEDIAPSFEFRDYAGRLAAKILQATDRDGLAYQDELRQATDLVRQDIRDRQLRPGLFRSAAGFKRPIFERVLLLWAEQGHNLPQTWQSDPSGYLTVRRETYAQALAAALSSTPYDADESGTVTDRERTARLGSIRIIL